MTPIPTTLLAHATLLPHSHDGHGPSLAATIILAALALAMLVGSIAVNLRAAKAR